nr:hypothetical protein [Galactobacter valiniphilus]
MKMPTLTSVKIKDRTSQPRCTSGRRNRATDTARWMAGVRTASMT